MDVGTTVVHTDSDDNTFAGQICGRDFKLVPVFRSKEGAIRRNPDGTLAERAQATTDTTKVERVDTGLFVVLATYRDGHQRVLTLAPEDLQVAPGFDAKPVFSHDVEPPPAPAVLTRGDFQPDEAPRD